MGAGMIDHDSWLNAQLNRHLDEIDEAEAYEKYREVVLARLVDEFSKDAGICADILSEALSEDDGFPPMLALAAGRDDEFCEICRRLVKEGIAKKAEAEVDETIRREDKWGRDDRDDGPDDALYEPPC